MPKSNNTLKISFSIFIEIGRRKSLAAALFQAIRRGIGILYKTLKASLYKLHKLIRVKASFGQSRKINYNQFLHIIES